MRKKPQTPEPKKAPKKVDTKRAVAPKPKKKTEASKEKELDKYDLFRKNIRTLRLGRGLDPKEAVAAMKLSTNLKRINDLEAGRGTLSADEMMKFAYFYNVSVEDLLNKTAVLQVVFL